MSRVFDGSPASEGIGSGRVRLVHWSIPKVPHEMVEPAGVEAEVDRFHDAREAVRERLVELKDQTEELLGPVEARIFDPQLLMLDDVEVVDGTVRYIVENRLTAPRAFDWRMIELQALWRRTNHPMVLDRLNDVEDLQIRLLNRLMGHPDPFEPSPHDGRLVIVAQNVSPTMTVQMDPAQIAGICTDLGTRTSHWAILARSRHIPAVVGLGNFFRHATEGQEAIVDGIRYHHSIVAHRLRSSGPGANIFRPQILGTICKDFKHDRQLL